MGTDQSGSQPSDLWLPEELLLFHCLEVGKASGEEPPLPWMTCSQGCNAVEAEMKSWPALLSVKSAEAGQIEQNHFHFSLH